MKKENIMKHIAKKTNTSKMATFGEYATPENFERLNNEYTYEEDDATTIYSSDLDMEQNTLSITVEYSTLAGFEGEPLTVVIDLRKEVKELQDKQSLLINIPTVATRAIINAFNDEGVHFNSQNFNGNESLGTDFFELENTLFKMELIENSKSVARYYFKIFKLGLSAPTERGGL